MTTRPGQRVALAAALAGVVLAASACTGGRSLEGGDGDGGGRAPQSLVVSTTWQPAPGEPDTAERRAELESALDELRAITGSGWVGRQDDVTGYLGELSGGRYAPADGGDALAVSEALLAEWGERLLGVAPEELSLEEPGNPTIAGVVTVRATQEAAGYPVLDGSLVLSLTDGDEQADDVRLNAVRGRVFPGLEPPSEPELTAREASATARDASGGDPRPDPRLVVLPADGGRLAWEVVVGPAPGQQVEIAVLGRYYVDAVTGDVLEARAGSAEVAAVVPLHQRAPVRARSRAEGDAVEVTGRSRVMGEVTATGTELADGSVGLLDTTTPTFDPATGEGGIETFDMQGLDDTQLPGRPVTSAGGQVADGDALGAHALARAVYDFYGRLGRRSWDDAGSSLVSSVNLTGPNACNAYFDDSLPRPQMVYGVPCEGFEFVQNDVAAHEITHGVIASSADLVYSGQPGALNEGFADYLGNVIGNELSGADDPSFGEAGCAAVADPTALCQPMYDTLATRDLQSGVTFGDYLYLLDTGTRFRLLTQDNQDNGGVHSNSLVWSNALWTIRSRLAEIDGGDGNASPLADDFDKIVYAALVTQLGPTAGFLDARRAVEQTIQAAGADPVILRVAREVFDAVDICAGCTAPEEADGQVVESSSSTQLAPTVSGEQVAWVDLSTAGGLTGVAATGSVGSEPATRSESAVQVAFAGEALVALEVEGYSFPGTLARYDADGTRTPLADIGISTITAGLAGGEDGAAWATEEIATASFLDPAGTLTELDLEAAGISSVTSVGTGDGLVALGTDAGEVYLWDPAGETVQQVGQVGGAVLAVATAGGRVLALDDEQLAALFDPSGAAVVLSETAVPFGAALGADYAVWPEAVGALGGGVAEVGGDQVVDTDLHLYSLGSGTIYNLLDARGQQAFPALSGSRLVWQDAVFGGDDILTAELPDGL
ncbi:M4 family metallopeptidase [Nocardioides nanhaiensis]|uniref:Peptidase M4 family protein n=1 Tax=Nocardioides nanhaiensis TaxID=1476871 RepID=A0ABP8VVZ4_9ACTN